MADCNGLQASGCVDEIAPLAPLREKWCAFGWRGKEVGGHDVDARKGGMLAYRDPGLRTKLERYRDFGIDKATGEIEYCGYNAKMDEFRAAMGLVNLPHLEAEIERRHHLADCYAATLADIPGIRTYPYCKDVRYNYAYYPTIVNQAELGLSRDELHAKLSAQGIQTRKLYDRLTCDSAIYAKYERDTAVADEIKGKALDLPIYGTLTEREIEQIAEAIKTARE